MPPDAPILRLHDVTFGFEGLPAFLGPLNVDIRRGELLAIIGPNGAGKSTTLRLLAGLLAPRSGRVLLGDGPLGDVHARERARHAAFLPQHPPGDLEVSALEVVLMGRFPHRRFGLFENASDVDIALAAMSRTETADLAGRSMATLSGGEAQRVHVAAALAQQPEVLLLDEPTTSLDLYHQLGIFSIFESIARDDHLAVVVVTHDINLAVRFATHVLLLDGGRSAAFGSPDDILDGDALARVYGVEMHVSETAGRRFVHAVSTAAPVSDRGAPS